MKTKNKHTKKGFTLVELLVVIGIIAVLAGIATPLIISGMKKGDLTEATKNAGTVATSLLEFKRQKGSYPCQITRDALEEDGVDNLPEGTDANAYLAQLIAAKVIDNEEVFYAAGVRGVTGKGDNMTAPGELLKKGENGFAYIMLEDEEPISGEKTFTPLIIAPLKKAGEKPTFDIAPYGSKYVYGKVDGSVTQGDINEDGTAKSGKREHLFAAGRDSVFGSEEPVIKAANGL